MKKNPLKSKWARTVRTLLMLAVFIAVILHMGTVSLVQVRDGVGTRFLIPSSAYSDTFTSSLIIQNLDLGLNTVTISAYDASGNPLGSPMTQSLFYGRQFRSSNILKDLGAELGSFGTIRVEERQPQLFSLKSDPQFAGLHSDSRWPELLRRMNLPTE